MFRNHRWILLITIVTNFGNSGFSFSAPPSSPDNDKENDNRTGSGQSTQGVIQRRRRPKRRSTGVVHIDMDVSVPTTWLVFIIWILLCLRAWLAWCNNINAMRGWDAETRDTDTYLNCVPLCVQIQDLEGNRDSTADAEDKEVNYYYYWNKYCCAISVYIELNCCWIIPHLFVGGGVLAVKRRTYSRTPVTLVGPILMCARVCFAHGHCLPNHLHSIYLITLQTLSFCRVLGI